VWVRMQRIQYCKVFKEVITGEKKVEETRKEVDVHIDKIASLQKRVYIFHALIYFLLH
jgi:hypothetical protein